MKTLLTISLLLSITFSLMAWKPKQKTTPTPAILKQYPFTMTGKEFAKKARGRKYISINKKLYWFIPKKFLTYDAKLCFSFDRSTKTIKEVLYILPLKAQKNTNYYIAEFDKIKSLLIKKYGDAVSPDSISKKSISGKKNWKKLSFSHRTKKTKSLKQSATWELKNFNIHLKSYKISSGRTSGRGVFINLAYTPGSAVKVAATTKKADPLAEL